MLVRTKIERKLIEDLAPQRLDVIDESDKHIGHAGAHPEGESHFRIEIVCAAFEGKSQVARQQMVYGALAELLQNRVHAMSLATLTPAEAEARKG